MIPAALLGAGLMAAFQGCGGTTSVEVATPQHSQIPASCEIVHDFGLVRPGSVHEYQFVVPNETGHSRRLVRIRQGCACVAAVPQEQTIAPRETLPVSVSYRAGGTLGLDRRRVSLYFAGESAPVDLVVQANIRQPLTCTPRRLDAPHSTGVPPVFTVTNFSEVDWDGLDFVGPKWVNFDSVMLPTAESRPPDAPRQVWRVSPVVSSEAPALRGRGVETITVAAKGRPEYTDSLLFGWDYRALLEAVPDQLHFGHVRQGVCIERHADLRLRREAVASTPRIVEVVSFVPGLDVQVTGKRGDWKLHAVFTATFAGPFETRIKIAAEGAEEIEVPIAGIVFAPTESVP